MPGLQIPPHSHRLSGFAVAGLALVAAGSFAEAPDPPSWSRRPSFRTSRRPSPRRGPLPRFPVPTPRPQTDRAAAAPPHLDIPAPADAATPPASVPVEAQAPPAVNAAATRAVARARGTADCSEHLKRQLERGQESHPPRTRWTPIRNSSPRGTAAKPSAKPAARPARGAALVSSCRTPPSAAMVHLPVRGPGAGDHKSVAAA